MIYVNVTTADGELLGRFEVGDEDIRRAGSFTVQQGIGREVFDQLPAAMFESEPEVEGLAPGFADALRDVYPDL